MTLWSLVSNASLVVKGVMLILLATVFASWVVIVQRQRVINAAKSSYVDFEDRFWSGMDLSQLYREITKEQPALVWKIFLLLGFVNSVA